MTASPVVGDRRREPLESLFPRILGRPPQVWRCWFDDRYGTSDEGLARLEHFVNYRADIETAYPIETDALACGLSAAPAALDRWRRAAAAFDELDAEASRDGGGGGEPTGALPAGWFQLLCHACGETLSAAECVRAWARKRGLERTSDSGVSRPYVRGKASILFEER